MTAQPAPRLRPYVSSYLGYRMAGFEPGVHRGLPSGHLTWIVGIGAPIEVVAQTDPHQPPASYRCVLSGLQARPAMIANPGHQEGIAIELTPLGLRGLLGMPARALWNTSSELADVVGVDGSELWERVQAAATWRERFAACDAVLGRLAGDHLVVPELGRAWRDLTRSGGTLAVEDLASRVGWSRQHLGHRFRDEFGLSPKLAARVIRFERARLMLQSTPSFVSIAQVAATCGYFDQAHLNRDFAEFAGCSPTQWMADEDLPSFQDRAPDEAAAWAP